jgi:plasmid stability protein
MGQMLVRKIDDAVLQHIRSKAKAGGKSAEQIARETLAAAFKPDRGELIRRMAAIRAASKPTSGQQIIDEIRWDRDHNLGRQ